MGLHPDAKTTMSDFVFNLDMDESLFSTEPPAGYTVQSMNVDVSPAEEKDLVTAFRRYTTLMEGAFPDSLDMQTMMMTVGKTIGMRSAIQNLRENLASGKGALDEEQMHKFEELMRKMMDWQLAPGKAKPGDEEIRKMEEQLRKILGPEKLAPGKGKADWEQMRKNMQAEMPKMMEANMKKVMEVQIPIQRGLMFALALPTDANAHYAGKGLSFGAADTPVFWYRPKEAKTYRVIYADLSVRDAAEPPSVPNAQPVPAPSSPKK
jgi:hypothetical protein